VDDENFQYLFVVRAQFAVAETLSIRILLPAIDLQKWMYHGLCAHQ
jgi:hypothetical protein